VPTAVLQATRAQVVPSPDSCVSLLAPHTCIHHDTMVIYKTVTEMEAEAADEGVVKPERKINRQITPGGNPIDNSQPAFPVYHRRFANPAPLGLLG